MRLLSAKCPRLSGRWEKTPYERRFGEPFRGPRIPFGWLVEYHSISVRDQSRLLQFGKNVLPGIFLGYALIAGRIWKGDIMIADFGRFGKDARIGDPSSKNQCKGSIDATKGEHFIFPVADGTAKLLGRDHEVREPTQRRDHRIKRWRWSLERLLVDSRWHHLSSSYGTSSSTLCATRRSIPYSTEVHWRDKVCSHWSGRHARKENRWLLECRFEQNFVRFVERNHEVCSIERRKSQGIYIYMW